MVFIPRYFWNCDEGIGYGTTVVCFWLNIYYIVVLAWALVYLFFALKSLFEGTQLPWATCTNTWNTPACRDFHSTNNLSVPGGRTMDEGLEGVIPTDSSSEFWKLVYRIQGMSSGVDDVTELRWELAIALLIAWLLVYAIIWKGIRSSGKVVYFTATFPYVMLVALLIRGVTLPGASEGIKYYLYPNFSRLGDSQVWLEAGTQIFFSYAVALGCMMALGSYNPFQNDFVKQAVFVAAINSGTSIFAGFVIFSVLGFMAHTLQLPVSEVVSQGPGLVFEAYPRALAEMPGSPIWASLFFFMILLVGIDSQFVGVEGFMTAVTDRFPRAFRGRRQILLTFTCLVSFLIGLLLVTDGGIYLFQVFDYYSASGLVLLFLCMLEAITIGWVYGSRKMSRDIHRMVGVTSAWRRALDIWLRACFTLFTPLLSFAVLMFTIVEFGPLKMGEYVFPAWGNGLGWFFILSSVLFVPGYFIYSVVRAPGNTFMKLISSAFISF
ncbi:unnamed protein product [Darwinula stevensoni]|uniref:Uncharacterized protein n=1 Tax=Darwinula stevensoni TaxID=69355 RepID=A0A7R8X402_9CRUS|nr:unnamed protein product [Darwinula stevensoni]CAG0879032.1 unnamed protein product [Darwinula stevensoni]